MKDKKDYINKRVSVIGFGRSGEACAKLLLEMGAKVFVSDIHKKERKIKGIEYEFEKHTERIYDAELIIISPGIPIDHPIVVEAKRRNIPVIGELEFAYELLSNPIIVGVTGTNGKTTTVFLIQKVLEAKNIKTIVCGNVGTPLSSVVGKTEKDTVLIVEVSTFQLESTVNFSPYIGILLNITPDHLNRHKSFKEYQNLKFKLFRNQSKKDFAILNFDDPRVTEINLESQKLFFSLLKPVTIWIKGEDIFWKANKLFSIKEINLKWKSLLPNYLASIGVGKIFGLSDTTIIEGLSAFKGVPHRLEYVGMIDGVRFINNSMCTNPASFVHTLRNFEKPIILIAGGKSKDVGIISIAEAIDKYTKYTILIGEVSEELSKLIKAEHKIASSMDEAVALSFQYAAKGDTILLSPGFASFDWFSDFRERGEKFKIAVKKIKNEKYR
jgi:UDP-N-acetylmuramoylalanine--D-glutamate ligase